MEKYKAPWYYWFFRGLIGPIVLMVLSIIVGLILMGIRMSS